MHRNSFFYSNLHLKGTHWIRTMKVQYFVPLRFLRFFWWSNCTKFEFCFMSASHCKKFEFCWSWERFLKLLSSTRLGVVPKDFALNFTDFISSKKNQSPHEFHFKFVGFQLWILQLWDYCWLSGLRLGGFVMYFERAQS